MVDDAAHRAAPAGSEAGEGAPLDVLTMGHALIDVMAESDDGLLQQLGLAKGTMALIDEVRAEEIYAAMGPGVEVSGGSAANTAAGVASLGGRAGYLGLVRDDLLGRVYTHDIRAAGVAFDVAPAVAGPGTGRCLILVTPDGERTMNTFLGASSDLGHLHVDPDLVGRAAVLYLESYLWDSATGREAYRHAIATARAAGRQVALSLSDPFCVERHRDTLRGLIDGEVDILFGNEAEITSLFEVPDVDEGIARLQATGKVAAVTLGAAGSVVVAGSQVAAVAVQPVDRVVDTTGAGDLYAAGFLVGMARGLGWAQCGQLGGLAAAEIISHFGARPQESLEKLAVTAGLLSPTA